MNSGDVVHHSAMLSTVPENHEKWTTSSGIPDNIDRNGWTSSIGISGQLAPENAIEPLIYHLSLVICDWSLDDLDLAGFTTNDK